MFKDIKVGDKVIVNGSLNEVTHVTKTRFKCGVREFLKESGNRYGASNIWTAHSAQKAEGAALELAQKDIDLLKARNSVAHAQQLILQQNARKLALEQTAKLATLSADFLKSVQEALQ